MVFEFCYFILWIIWNAKHYYYYFQQHIFFLCNLCSHHVECYIAMWWSRRNPKTVRIIKKPTKKLSKCFFFFSFFKSETLLRYVRGIEPFVVNLLLLIFCSMSTVYECVSFFHLLENTRPASNLVIDLAACGISCKWFTIIILSIWKNI